MERPNKLFDVLNDGIVSLMVFGLSRKDVCELILWIDYLEKENSRLKSLFQWFSGVENIDPRFGVEENTDPRDGLLGGK